MSTQPNAAVKIERLLNLGAAITAYDPAAMENARRQFGAKTHEGSVALENSGMLLASGLITGEAIMGVGIALAVAAAPILLPTERAAIGGTLALLATLGMLVYLYARTLRAARAMQSA